MCDRWASICRSRPFSEPALLFWASDTRRHPGCSDVSLCQNVWASRTELAEKWTLKPLEDTPWGKFNHSLAPYLSLLTLRTSHRTFLQLAPNSMISFLLSPLCLYLYHTVNPSIGSVLLLAHGDAHLSMKEFILAANHSRGVVIKYRCANTLTSLMHCVEGSNLNQYWGFKYTRKKYFVCQSSSEAFSLPLKEKWK